jgi:hypothetical protein
MPINFDIRRNPDDTLDEIVGTGDLHVEQMDENIWWLGFYPDPDNPGKRVSLFLSAEGPITAQLREEP